MEGSKLFTVMVVGEAPDQLMSKYQIDSKVSKYIKYKYSEAKQMKNNSIKLLKEIISNPKSFNFNLYHLDYITKRIKYLETISDFDYYCYLTQGLEIDKNGDAWSDINPQGKWKSYKLGDFFSMPLILKDGNQTHQAYNKDINWSCMHLKDTDIYEITWDLVHNIREPINDAEKQIIKNMGDKKNYFDSFSTKEEYVIHNSAYWNYAYLDENGWKDIDDSNKTPFEWISSYYNTYVEPLHENDKITIFECAKN